MTQLKVNGDPVSSATMCDHQGCVDGSWPGSEVVKKSGTAAHAPSALSPGKRLRSLQIVTSLLKQA